jgi:3-oxoacyl-[acyl-carrier-protein] synthase II
MSQWTGDPAGACRPFDLGRDGFVMGEGAASLVIEEYEHAKARGAHIYGEVLGYSLNNDAYHMTTPLPGGEAGIRAITDALTDAKVNPDQINYINGHASSTQMNDSNECFCVQAALGADVAAKIPISGTKPYTAHPLGATGAMEAIICALALDNNWVPPTLNFETPDPACPLDIVPNEGREKKLDYILTNSFGFGGINSCAVLGRV